MILITNSGFSFADSFPSRGDANRHKCVPNKNRADFPPVLESDHTRLSRRNQRGRQCDGSERPALRARDRNPHWAGSVDSQDVSGDDGCKRHAARRLDALRALLLAERASRAAIVAERDKLVVRNERLEAIISEIRRAYFGRKSERITDDQLSLALEELGPKQRGSSIRWNVPRYERLSEASSCRRTSRTTRRRNTSSESAAQPGGKRDQQQACHRKPDNRISHVIVGQMHLKRPGFRDGCSEALEPPDRCRTTQPDPTRAPAPSRDDPG
jgi:Transposase C of IS166 homeodomain